MSVAQEIARAETNAGKRRGRPRKPTARIDAEGQESVISVTEVANRIDELVELYTLAEESGAKLNDAIKATAEKSGLLAATVRKYVVAKASDDFDGHKRKVVQLALVFEIDSE